MQFSHQRLYVEHKSGIVFWRICGTWTKKRKSILDLKKKREKEKMINKKAIRRKTKCADKEHSQIFCTTEKEQNCGYAGSVQCSRYSCPTLCNPTDHSTPGLPVHHQLTEFTQTHVHWVGDAIQPSHPLTSPSPLTFILSQHWGLFQWVTSSHQVARVL